MVDNNANPNPLGLINFGMTTILINIHHAGFFPLTSVIISMGIFHGGIAQIIAGIFEYKKGNTFSFTVFLSYGLFWHSLIALLVFPTLIPIKETPKDLLGIYLFIWGVFTFFMFFGTLNTNRVLQFIFISQIIIFFLLSIGNLFEKQIFIKIAGFEGIICGISACYLAIAEILNEKFKKNLFPIGCTKKNI